MIDLLTDVGAVGLALFELGGASAVDACTEARAAPQGIVRVGVHRGGSPAVDDPAAFDILLSDDAEAPAPWVGLTGTSLDRAIDRLREVAATQPVATTVAAQVHRMTLALDFQQAVTLESLAYSMLLASSPFKAWRAATLVRVRGDGADVRLRLDDPGDRIEIVLTRAGARNAVDARMRDALVEALEFAALDPDRRAVVLRGEGPSFSAGGDLDEFGQADDPGRAHAVRALRSAAQRVQAIGDRVTARLHGACVGAGIEIPAAAGRVLARPGSFFRLPEVSMGLIPGAGGTASIPRRIGRHRACFMAIAGEDIDVATALRWGLIDGLDDAA